MQRLMWMAVLGVVSVVSPTIAEATSDQECFDNLHGYDPIDGVVWKQTDCMCTSGFSVLDVKKGTKASFRSVAARTKEVDGETCAVAPKNAAKRASYRRARPLTALAPAELRVEMAKKYEKDFDADKRIPLKLAGAHIVGRRFKLKLAGRPKVEFAALIGDTKLGIAEVRYGSMAGCCPYQGEQEFIVFRYRATAVKAAAAELRVGPDYVALTHGKKRHQLSLPPHCGHSKKKGKSAPAFPFDIPCKKGDSITVERTGMAIAMRRGTHPVARLHVGTKTTVRIIGEQILNDGYDGMGYTRERIVCTYGNRCTQLSDNHALDTLAGPTKPMCRGSVCLLVPTRRRHRTTLAYRVDGDDASHITMPVLSKGERVIEVAEGSTIDAFNLVVEAKDKTRRTVTTE